MKYLAIFDVLLIYYSSLDFFRFQIDSKNEIEIQVGGGGLQANRRRVGGRLVRQPADNPRIYQSLSVLHVDRTRRTWVAPARNGRYVLGQLRSRTAEASLLSFWDGV